MHHAQATNGIWDTIPKFNDAFREREREARVVFWACCSKSGMCEVGHCYGVFKVSQTVSMVSAKISGRDEQQAMHWGGGRVQVWVSTFEFFVLQPSGCYLLVGSMRGIITLLMFGVEIT